MSLYHVRVEATRNLIAGLKKMEIAVSNIDALPEAVILVFDAGTCANWGAVSFSTPV